jgi:hypothetical protein
MGTIFGHHDADGITSSYFTSFAYPDYEIKLTEEFGDTKGWVKDDVMCDMRPNDPNIEGLVIDHHLPHSKKRNYELISDTEDTPATLLAWREYKDKIPKSEWWKIVIGLAGDGKATLIPTEIFDLCPTLLRRVKTSVYERYGLKVNQYPLYGLLSSYINAFLRKGEYESAINLLKYADSPLTIYTSDDARIAKQDTSNDYKLAIKDAEIIDYGIMQLIIYYSKYRMSGYIASAMQSPLDNKTIMAINERNGSLSLRGDLTEYIKDKLASLKYIEIDGHSGFMGGKLKKNHTKLIADLEKLL